METFRIRAYGKSELAMMYFPTSAGKHTAVNHLMAWVARCEPLMADLKATGYQKSAKFFTSRQVEKIVYHLGTP